MGSGMLSIGITGIQAAQMALQVTQHNIANAHTTGYSRQYTQQSAGIPQASGSGYFGSGTTVDTVRRAYDQTLTAQVYSAQSSASESSAFLTKISQIDNMLGDQNSGLAPALQDFFKGVQQVATSPSLTSARQSMLSSAQSVVSRFGSLSGRLNELYDGVNSEVVSEVQAINGYTQQIADVNEQITRAQAATSQPANDLLDLRDQLVAELNKHIRVQTVEDSNGNFNVFTGNGQQLVVGTTVSNLVAMNSSSDPERVVVGLKGQTGSIQEMAESQIQGGALGGLMAFRSNSLDGAASSLGQIAASLALTFNAQHALGQDLNGLNQTSSTAGFQANFFTLSGPKVLANSTTAATVTASFLPPSINASNGGTYAVTDTATGNPSTAYTLQVASGTLTLTRVADGTQWSAADLASLSGQIAAEPVNVTPASGSFYTNLTGSDYVLRASAGSITLTRSSDGQAWTAANVTALNGLITGEGISLGGAAPTVGVDYLIEPTRGVASSLGINASIAADVKRIAAGMPSVSSLGTANTGSLNVSQGSVANGYSLSNLPATFTYNQVGDNFTFGFPASGSVSATYANGTTVNIAAGSIARQNAGSEITKITYNGITVDLSGMPRNNDTFSISANLNGVSDNRNAVKLASLQTQNTTAGGKASYQGTYASLVSEVGAMTSQIKITGAAQQSLLTQNENARSSVSGVNLDEEAANLLRYQQAYQASAKSLDVASKLFDTLLSIFP